MPTPPPESPLVLIDLRLSHMDGADAARELADGTRTSGIAVVALSSAALVLD